MKYLLPRNFSDGERYYERSPFGTDFPDTIRDLPVVLEEDWDGTAKQFPLPRGTVIYTEPGADDPEVLIVQNKPDKPIGLSQIKTLSAEELLAKKA